MSWHVLGAGSLGMLWAGRLAAGGCTATLILRNQSSLEAYARAGGIRISQSQQQTLFKLPAQTAETPEPIGRLILACKAYDAEAAIASVSHRLSAKSTVLLLQNGLGSQSAVAAQIPETRCILLSSTEGAFRDGDFSVNFVGQGHNWLGDPKNPHPPDWLYELNQAGIPHEWSSAIAARLWRKLAVNCTINPLCVLHNCRNGGLQQYPDEVAGICRELGSLLELSIDSEAADGLLEEAQKIIQATADNYCSMLQDVQRQQRTEISFLLGFACAQAQRKGLRAPQLNDLHQRLRNHLQSLGLPCD